MQLLLHLLLRPLRSRSLLHRWLHRPKFDEDDSPPFASQLIDIGPPLTCLLYCLFLIDPTFPSSAAVTSTPLRICWKIRPLLRCYAAVHSTAALLPHQCYCPILSPPVCRRALPDFCPAACAVSILLSYLTSRRCCCNQENCAELIFFSPAFFFFSSLLFFKPIFKPIVPRSSIHNAPCSFLSF